MTDKIVHPIPIDTKVLYESKGCNCSKVKSKPVEGVIKRSACFNGVFWYAMNNGKQYHQSKILKLL